MSRFISTMNKGFQMTFESGWTISVQWGVGNYCERKSFTVSPLEDQKQITVESSNAEIAIWDKNGEWYTFDNGDTVLGHLTADEVAEWISAAQFGMLVN